MSTTKVEAAPMDNPLVQHAERELRLAGFFDADSDYDGMLGSAVMDVVRAFAGRGHSGMSAMIVRQLFAQLSNFEALTPLTSDPDEWIDRSEMSGKPFWQNKRDFRAFSEDGGKTWKMLEEGNWTWASSL